MILVAVLAGGEEATLVVAPGDAIEVAEAETGATLEATLDGGLLRPAKSPLLAPATGDHWLALAARDPAGNLSPPRFILLRVDGEPPELALSVTPEPIEGEHGRRWVAVGAEVAAQAEDALAGVAEVVLEHEGHRLAAGGDGTRLVLEVEGPVELEAVAVDRVGNRVRRALEPFSVDATPPGGRVEIEGSQERLGDRLVVGPATTIAPQPADAGSGVAAWEPSVDGARAAAERLAGPWPEGDHRVEVAVVDRVGNRGRLEPLELTVDATPPELEWRVVSTSVEGAGGALWAVPPVRVEVRASDDLAGVAGVEWNDGASWRPVDGQLEVTGDGVALRALDRVGNRAQTRAGWTIDLEPPGLRLVLPEAAAADELPTVAVEQAARVEVVDRGCGLAEARYRIGGGRWAPLPERFYFLHAGHFTLEVEAVDRLGNRARLEQRVRVVASAEGGAR